VARVRVQGVGHVRPASAREWPGQGRSRSTARAPAGMSCCPATTCPLSRWPLRAGRVGIDMGVTHFLSTSDGVHAGEPEVSAESRRGPGRRAACGGGVLAPQPPAQEHEAPSGRHQGRSSASQGGAAALHHAHKVANVVVRGADTIAHERLRAANMVRRPKPARAGDRVFEPNGAATPTVWAHSMFSQPGRAGPPRGGGRQHGKPTDSTVRRSHESIAGLLATQGDYRRAYRHLRAVLDLSTPVACVTG
jgi:putative transposase